MNTNEMPRTSADPAVTQEPEREQRMLYLIGLHVTRAEAAEAKVRAVEALDADEWERRINSRFGTDAVHRLVAEAVASIIHDAIDKARV